VDGEKIVHRAKVTTPCPFPLDMLRYDACWPESTQDAIDIGKSLKPGSRASYTVTLCRYSQGKGDSGWTPARWRSFGCILKTTY
jgi:hypothetical protein